MGTAEGWRKLDWEMQCNIAIKESLLNCELHTVTAQRSYSPFRYVFSGLTSRVLHPLVWF